ncbi:carboxypeptidase regulatory-like domain-containing protein, partial [Candidatus Roizmanbacteria bacterium]|nr:carboxypeptidase regulatory-like domain-containing protein [Candidatus Roizmanbacteria bacterium]
VIKKFYGVNIVKPNELAQLKGSSELETLKTGNEGGQQQGTFIVKIPVKAPTTIPVIQGAAPAAAPQVASTKKEWDERDRRPAPCEAKGDCRDPYGRVFDAVSLEPIPNAKVTLFSQRPDQSFSYISPKETANAIINPWTTKEDGKFVFMVPPGVYRLEAQVPNYTFPFSSKELNPQYSKAYYELYYGSGFTDQNIIETKIEHRDIPVMPNGEPYRAQVKLVGYMSELNKEKMIYEISGRTSHPLTVVEILGKNLFQYILSLITLKDMHMIP